MRSFELFAGGGGLALGLERAGFKHVGLIEFNHDSCDTLRANGDDVFIRRNWPVIEIDAQEYYFHRFAGQIHLLAGGPPCQPFSIAGKHAGDKDQRNMFPVVFQAVRAMWPQAIFLENVRGLASGAFHPYLEYILLQLRFPTIVAERHEHWTDHKTRLEHLRQDGSHLDLTYNVFGPQKYNLVNFGIPQNRERLFIIAFRSDLNVEWQWPTPTYSKDALLYDQWVTREYWQRHHLSVPAIPDDVEHAVAKLRRSGQPDAQPWKTVRDALWGLPEPLDHIQHPLYPNHIGIPGARSYYGHSGSLYDLPAKTLKAGDHGVPGGENMLLRDDGTVRYFTVRESARLQTFPDDYVFCGSRSEAMRQIGNAVPVQVAELIARHVAKQLKRASRPATQQGDRHVINHHLLGMLSAE